jgi:CDP-diacylglycerol--glycerol-3-phosphate 3-phosphatidyltransferase
MTASGAQCRPKSYFAPNLVIVLRVALAFVAIGLYSLPFPFSAAAVPLTIVIVSLDALDGIVARRRGVASDVGAVLDVTADRIVEHIFWIYFAVALQVSVWVPIVIMTRSFAVDAMRSMALARGKTALGDKTMMRSSIARFLVASRFMRNLYGFAKVAAFLLLGSLIVVEQAQASAIFMVSTGAYQVLDSSAAVFVVAAVALCVVRGLPVLSDGRTYLFDEALPS